MIDQRLIDKKNVINAFRSHKTGLELSSFLTDYFKKYCVSDEIIFGEITKIDEKEKKEDIYDVLTAPLLSGLS